MASTSMSLGPHWEAFIKEKVASGEFSSATDVVRAALRAMKDSETGKARLDNYLQQGEDSGYTEWDPAVFKRRIQSRLDAVAEDLSDYTHEN